MLRTSLRAAVLAASVCLALPTFAQAQLGGAIIEQGSGGRSFNDANPDIAYDPVNNYYAHVFEGGAGPHSIRLKLFDGTTRSGISGGDVGVSVGTSDNINPRVAYIAKSGLFVVVWQTDANGNWDIMCRTYDPTAKALGPATPVATSTADEITPDIAGDGTKVGDDAVVVWDNEGLGILGATIKAPNLTTVTVGTAQTLSPGPAPLNNNPSISRSGGAGRRVAVVWELSGPSMVVRAYDMALAPASATLSIGITHAFPQIDGDGTDFLIVFQRPQPNQPTLGDIWCCSVKVPLVAQVPMTLTVPPRALGTQPNDEMRPTVAFVGGSYLTAWGVKNLNDQFGKCQIQTVTPDCNTCGTGWLVQFGNRLRTASQQAIGSAYNSDAATTQRRARVLYDTGFIRNNAPASLCQKVNFDVVGGGTSNVAANCGTGGTLSIPEPFAFGEVITASLTGADANATSALFVVGIQGKRTQFPCATCRVLLGLVIVGVPVTGGQVRVPARIPCDATLNNFELDFQYVVFTPTSSPCPATLPGLSTSNIVRGKIQ